MSEQAQPLKEPRGFACLSPDRRREIARQGGKTAQERGTGHRFTSDEAREIGNRMGPQIVEKRGKEWMAALGRKDGLITSSNHDRMVRIGRLCGLATQAQKRSQPKS